MRSTLRFPVIVEKKIPYLSAVIEKILLTFLIVAGLSYLILLPFNYAKTEMEIVALFHIYPAWIFKIYSASLFGFLFFVLLNIKLRAGKQAFLDFNDDNIRLEFPGSISTIAVNQIREIKFYEANLHSVLFRQKLYIFVFLRYDKPLRIKLVHFEHSEQVIDSFLSYDLQSLPKEIMSLVDGEEYL